MAAVDESEANGHSGAAVAVTEAAILSHAGGEGIDLPTSIV